MCNRFAGALTAVGSKIASALGQLFNYIWNLVRQLLSSDFAPFHQSGNRYSSGVSLALVSAKANTTASGNITQAGAQGIWTALGGVIFEVGLVVAITLEVVVTILSLISFGLSTLVSLLVGLVLTAVLGFLFPTLQAYVVSATAYSAEGVTNKTVSQSTNQPLWRTLGDAFAWFDTGFTTTYAAKELQTALQQGAVKSAFSSFFEKAVAFALGVVAAALAGAAEVGVGNQFLSIAAMCFAFGSVVLDLLSIAQDKLKPTSDTSVTLPLVILGLDGGAAAVSVLDPYSGK